MSWLVKKEKIILRVRTVFRIVRQILLARLVPLLVRVALENSEKTYHFKGEYLVRPGMDKPSSYSYGCGLVHVPDLRHNALHRDWRHDSCLIVTFRFCLVLRLVSGRRRKGRLRSKQELRVCKCSAASATASRKFKFRLCKRLVLSTSGSVVKVAFNVGLTSYTYTSVTASSHNQVHFNLLQAL